MNHLAIPPILLLFYSLLLAIENRHEEILELLYQNNNIWDFTSIIERILHVYPKNLEEVVSMVGDNASDLPDEDIHKLKESMRRGATYYDSTSKAGTENELLIWVQLKENSKVVLPNLSSLIKMETGKRDGKVVLDLSGLSDVLTKFDDEIEKTEIFRNEGAINIENKPENTKLFNI